MHSFLLVMQILKILSEKCAICTGFAQISHPLFYITKISKQYLLHTKLENLLFW
jgi:hypothetical protein